MPKLLFVIALLLSIPAAAQEAVSRVAFGSCLRQNRDAPILDTILESKPDVFVFLGDNVYADTEDEAKMREIYRIQGERPGVKKLFESTRVLATWDDHDYGKNDAGVEFPAKEMSKNVFLDFFREPKDSPRRSRAGIYDSVILGPAGKRVQIILLDTRSFRSPLVRAAVKPAKTGPYLPSEDSNATLLGEAQWVWLAEQLARPAEVRIIASSIQLIADEHGWEKWANFPLERERMIDLIFAAKGKSVVISGDRHLAEICSLDVKLPGAFCDITSSSLNMQLGDLQESNKHRIGENYTKANFGMIEIEWNETGVETMRMTIRDVQGKPVIDHSMR